MIRYLMLTLLVSGLTLGHGERAMSAPILYGADGSGGAASTLYTIDPTTGIATPVGAIGFSITALAWDSTTSTLYGGTSSIAPVNGLITINRSTGTGTLVGAYGAGNGMSDLAIDSAGNLFGWEENNSTDDLYSITKGTGVAALVGEFGAGTGTSAIAFDSTDALYFTGASTQPGCPADIRCLHTISTVTGGLLSTVAESGGGGSRLGAGASFDSSDTLFAILKTGGSGGTRSLATVNTTTGVITTIGPTAAGLDALV